eukprot:scaffold323_cov363-Pavlova_lutheri.AAC.8
MEPVNGGRTGPEVKQNPPIEELMQRKNNRCKERAYHASAGFVQTGWGTWLATIGDSSLASAPLALTNTGQPKGNTQPDPRWNTNKNGLTRGRTQLQAAPNHSLQG